MKTKPQRTPTTEMDIEIINARVAQAGALLRLTVIAMWEENRSRHIDALEGVLLLLEQLKELAPVPGETSEAAE